MRFFAEKLPPLFPYHTCEASKPTAVVPVPGKHEGREVMKTALMYRCHVCHCIWEQILDGLYKKEDFD